MRLLLARHAPTDWNTQARFQGHEDIALGDTGRPLAALRPHRCSEEAGSKGSESEGGDGQTVRITLCEKRSSAECR